MGRVIEEKIIHGLYQNLVFQTCTYPRKARKINKLQDLCVLSRGDLAINGGHTHLENGASFDIHPKNTRKISKADFCT